MNASNFEYIEKVLDENNGFADAFTKEAVYADDFSNILF